MKITKKKSKSKSKLDPLEKDLSKLLDKAGWQKKKYNMKNEYDFSNGKRVDPSRVDHSPKVMISLRLDPEIVSNMKDEADQLGVGYQALIGEILKKHLGRAIGTDRFIIINKQEYQKLKDEVLSLQRSIHSIIELVEGKSKSFTDVETHFSELFDKVGLKARKKTKTKKR